jgi:hypothetical protein
LRGKHPHVCAAAATLCLSAPLHSLEPLASTVRVGPEANKPYKECMQSALCLAPTQNTRTDDARYNALARSTFLYPDVHVSESSSTPAEVPKPLTQQFFDLVQSERAKARELRAAAPGLPSSDADALDAHADKLEDNILKIVTESEIKREGIRQDKWLKEHEGYLAWHLENNRSIISMSQTAVRVIATSNAGAAVALLAFLGNALAKDSHLVAALFAPALLIFAAGVVVAVLVAGSSYFTQLFYGDEAKLKLAVRLHILSAVLWFATTGLFAAGCVETYIAVRSMPSKEESPVTTSIANGESAELKRNAPPPARPAAEPPAVRVPTPTPPATQPQTHK